MSRNSDNGWTKETVEILDRIDETKTALRAEIGINSRRLTRIETIVALVGGIIVLVFPTAIFLWKACQ